MQGLQDNNAEQQKTTEASLQRVQHELTELQRRHIKLGCHSRRGNLKFYVKLSSFHDKNFIKSFIKNLTKGRNLGISDDFPKEVEEMRKKLYPVLNAAKQEKRTISFKVERSVALPRPRDNCFPSLRTFNGRIN